ncbi:MAG: ASCH domain-containing protein [Calothrix sp. MO_192.B10]|nr:ASCH domain-containing protein [Calothrix sp. MO_192.B10]
MKLKELGLIQRGEVANPELLEAMFGLPMGYSSPVVSKVETPPLADAEKHLEIPSVENVRSQPSKESSTSTRFAKSVKEPSGKYSSITSATLKAISLWQPWASLIPLGLKHYETRSWKTNYRGKLLICSTLNNPKHYREYLKIKDELQLPPWDETNFPHGQAIALCDLVDCIQMTAEFIEQQSETEILCGDWQVGRYAWKLENIQPITEPFAVKGKQGLFNIPLTNIQAQKELTELLGDKQINPSNDNLLGDISNSPSNSPSNNFSPELDSPSKKRRRGEGNGYIHWRIITKKGKDYPQAYYHWKEGNKKRSKYIPKHLLGAIQEAEAAKRPVIKILELLGVAVSPSNLLGDNQINPSNDQLLGDNESSPSNLENSPGNSPSKVDFSPSKRRKGEGSGSIHWRTITRGAKDYPQAYYHYEIWNGGDRLVKSSKYIPKRLLSQVQLLEVEKAPVREILGVLGVKL